MQNLNPRGRNPLYQSTLKLTAYFALKNSNHLFFQPDTLEFIIKTQSIPNQLFIQLASVEKTSKSSSLIGTKLSNKAAKNQTMRHTEIL